MGLKTVVLNSERMNYDGKLDLSVLSSEVKEYASTEQDQILERVQGMDVVVTKEMPVDGDTIARFPDSVQLICEAGTGNTTICDIEAQGPEVLRYAIFRLTAQNVWPIQRL